MVGQRESPKAPHSSSGDRHPLTQLKKTPWENDEGKDGSAMATMTSQWLILQCRGLTEQKERDTLIVTGSQRLQNQAKHSLVYKGRKVVI